MNKVQNNDNKVGNMQRKKYSTIKIEWKKDHGNERERKINELFIGEQTNEKSEQAQHNKNKCLLIFAALLCG